MNNKMICSDEELRKARELVTLIEQGDEDGARRVVQDLAHIDESFLFHEVCRLTRGLHETLSRFVSDSSIANYAEKEIPDAKERLHYVIAMTQQAANRTLAAVEAALPICDDVASSAQRHGSLLAEALGGNSELKKIADRQIQFLDGIGGDVDRLKLHLQDVLLAQEFQDLTGQIIQRVICLVEDLQNNLVNLIRIAGHRSSEAPVSSPSALEGPRVPGLAGKDTVSGQDEVDDLLSSLGF